MAWNIQKWPLLRWGGEVASALALKSTCILLLPKNALLFLELLFNFPELPFCFLKSFCCFPEVPFCFQEVSFYFSKVPYYFPELPLRFPEVPSFYLLCMYFSKNPFSSADCSLSFSCSELLRQYLLCSCFVSS